MERGKEREREVCELAVQGVPCCTTVVTVCLKSILGSFLRFFFPSFAVCVWFGLCFSSFASQTFPYARQHETTSAPNFFLQENGVLVGVVHVFAGSL